MASQDVEFDAIADTGGKFARLAKLLGLADADHALGRMTHLWMACTTRGETDLPQWLVEHVLGERGPDALVEVELARWARGRGDSKTRRMYICGAKKHCVWLRRNQDQSSKAGEMRAANASRVAGRFSADRAGAAGGVVPDQLPADHAESGDHETDQSYKSSKEYVQNTSPLPSPSPSPSPEEDLRADSPDAESAQPPAAPLTLIPEPPVKPPRKKAKHDLPEAWQPTARQREVAQQSALDLDDQVRRFRNHHAARGNQFVSWDRAFDTWLDNAPRFAEGTRSGPRGSAERADPPRKIPTLA